MPNYIAGETPAYRRADFMYREGTALFGYFTRTALVDVLQTYSGAILSSDTCAIMELGDPQRPMDQAYSIVATHKKLTAKDALIAERTRYAPSDEHEPNGTQVNKIRSILRAATFQATMGRIMNEAHDTLLRMPLNLLNNAQAKSVIHREPPVYTSLEEIAGIYRSEWFQGVCTDAAMTANGVWQSFSTQPDSGLPPELHPSDEAFVLSQEDGRSQFRFSDNALHALRARMSERNQDARRRSKDPKDKLFREDSISGSTSGCPVAHINPHLRLDNPDHLERLKAVASVTGISPESLVGQEKNGIAVGLEAVADMFDRCLPYIIAAEQVYKEKS